MAGPECIVCDGREGPGLRYCPTCQNLICRECRPRFEESPAPDQRSSGSDDDSGAESWYEPPEIPATWCFECRQPLLREPLPPSPPRRRGAPSPPAQLLAPVIDLRTPEPPPGPVIDLRTPEPPAPAIELITPGASLPPPLRPEPPEFAEFPWRGRHRTGVRVGIGNPAAGAEFGGVVVYMVNVDRGGRPSAQPMFCCGGQVDHCLLLEPGLFNAGTADTFILWDNCFLNLSASQRVILIRRKLHRRAAAPPFS